MTPASLDELLKEWEAEANESISQLSYQECPSNYKRILSLIAVVRKQREALERICNVNQAKDDYITAYIAKEALTEAERILKE